jgi:hypothetical protein
MRPLAVRPILVRRPKETGDRLGKNVSDERPILVCGLCVYDHEVRAFLKILEIFM